MQIPLPKPVLATAASLTILAFGSATAHALPNMGTQTGNSCFACHAQLIAEQPAGVSLSGEKDGRVVTGKLSVTSASEVVDLGTQLDGQELGALETFKGPAGTTFQLVMEVLDGVDAHTVQLKQLEKGGQKTSEDNLLVWTASIDPSTPWEAHTLDGSPPYYALDILGGEDPKQYTFNLVVDASTPVDVYDLVFSVPGQDAVGLFYEEEHFYLEITEASEPSPGNELVNIATRGFVGSGDGVMIGGFVVSGEDAGGTILIRGIGPTLGEFGVADTIADPVIALFDAGGEKIYENDDWGDDPAIQAAALQVGGFELAAGSSDAALLISDLPPGSYTAQLSSKEPELRIGLIEIYKVD